MVLTLPPPREIRFILSDLGFKMTDPEPRGPKAVAVSTSLDQSDSEESPDVG